MHDVSHSAFEGINVQEIGQPAGAPTIGILYDSDDNPGSTFNVVKNLTIAGFHQGLVVFRAPRQRASTAAGTPVRSPMGGCS